MEKKRPKTTTGFTVFASRKIDNSSKETVAARPGQQPYVARSSELNMLNKLNYAAAPSTNQQPLSSHVGTVASSTPEKIINAVNYADEIS